jgi:hypothetical protein
LTQRGLHADFISLRPEAEPAAIEALLTAATALAELPMVERVYVLDPDAGAAYDLIVLFFLDSATAIEGFGTDPRYARFLQGAVAPVLQHLDGADLGIEGDAGDDLPYAACYCLAAPLQTFDWEARDRMNAWRDGLDAAWSVTGIATGDRDRFRGVALAVGESPFGESGVAPPSLEVRGRLRRLA